MIIKEKEVFAGWGGFCQDIIEYMKVLDHGSANFPFTLCIPLLFLKRASLERLCPVVYLSSAFYTQNKPTPAFTVKVTFTPPLAYLKLRKWYWLLVYFGQLYKEIHIFRNRKFTQACP